MVELVSSTHLLSRGTYWYHCTTEAKLEEEEPEEVIFASMQYNKYSWKGSNLECDENAINLHVLLTPQLDN